MRRYILLIMAMLPLVAHAEIPAINNLFKSASKQRHVEHTSIGSFMLGMASTFSDKEVGEVFEMLDNIEMIECTNVEYAPTLLSRTLSIVESLGAQHLGSNDDGTDISDIYCIYSGDNITELIIIVKGHNGNLDIVCMSGNIPEHRLADIAKIKQ